MTGIELIAQERERQISVEGWTSGHDDGYPNGELAIAAACYAIQAATYFLDHKILLGKASRFIIQWWPWADKWWKPRDPARDLAKAGALIAAEIDRISRR